MLKTSYKISSILAVFIAALFISVTLVSADPGDFDLDARDLILDADADTNINGTVDDVIDFIGGGSRYAALSDTGSSVLYTLGRNDSRWSQLYLYGDDGSTNPNRGGELRFYFDALNDSTDDWCRWRAYSNNFNAGCASTGNALVYYQGSGYWSLENKGLHNIGNASTDFTSSTIALIPSDRTDIGASGVDSVGVFGVGGSAGERRAIYFNPSINSESTWDGAIFKVKGTINRNSATGNTFAGTWLVAPSDSGSAAITNAATLYIQNAPSYASNNLALWVDTGESWFDSAINLRGTSYLNAIDSLYLNLDYDNSGSGNAFTIGHNVENTSSTDRLFTVQDDGRVQIDTWDSSGYWGSGATNARFIVQYDSTGTNTAAVSNPGIVIQNDNTTASNYSALVFGTKNNSAVDIGSVVLIGQHSTRNSGWGTSGGEYVILVASDAAGPRELFNLDGNGSGTATYKSGTHDFQNNDLTNLGDAGTDITSTEAAFGVPLTADEGIIIENATADIDPIYREHDSTGPWVSEILDHYTNTGDNVLRPIIQVTVANSPSIGYILLDYIIMTNAERTGSSGTVRIDIVRRQGSDTAYAIATAHSDIEQTSGGFAENLTTTFSVSALTGASSATQTFDIEVTIDSDSSANPTIQYYGRLLSGDNVAGDAASEITWARY